MAAARARPSVAILGCGAVGETLANGIAAGWKKLRRPGELLLWSRRAEHADFRRHCLASPVVRVRVLAAPEEALSASAAVLLCLPDGVIVPIADRLALSIPVNSRVRPAVLHTNGLLGADALGALREKGVAVGKLHPLCAVNQARTPMSSVAFGIEGDPRALGAARGIIRLVGGLPVPLRRGTGPEYHAAASLLSGGIVALFELADQHMQSAVPSRKARHRALDMLAYTSLLNVLMYGTRSALTGAISRGAQATVRGHLKALRSDRDALEAYRVLGRTMLELARARRSIDAGAHRQLARLLGAPRRKR